MKTKTKRAQGKGLTKAAEAAAKKLREEAWEICDATALRTVVRGLNPGWEDHLCMDEYLLLKHTDWHDGSEPSVGAIAKFYKYTNERRLLAKQCLLAARANNWSGSKHTVTYQLVMDVEHPLVRDVVARVDVETREVKLGKPWLEAEKDAKKVLTGPQLAGEVCAVCAGAGDSILGLWSLATKPLRCCRECTAPDNRMVERWCANSTQAESGVAS